MGADPAEAPLLGRGRSLAIGIVIGAYLPLGLYPSGLLFYILLTQAHRAGHGPLIPAAYCAGITVVSLLLIRWLRKPAAARQTPTKTPGVGPDLTPPIRPGWAAAGAVAAALATMLVMAAAASSAMPALG